LIFLELNITSKIHVSGFDSINKWRWYNAHHEETKSTIL
jgi:hypothetical protein